MPIERIILPEWRNPKHNARGTIDLEIEHPVHGWIPFTADPEDVNPKGKALYDAAVELGEVADCDPPSAARVQEEILAGVQRRLDDWARTRNYDGILSACTYASDPDSAFAAEGQRAVDLRSETWRALYQMLAEVQGGTRPMPSGYADIEAELPVLAWPV